MWTGPDDRHVADQDIEQSRKLIDIGVAQEANQDGSLVDHVWMTNSKLSPSSISVIDRNFGTRMGSLL